MPLLCGTDPVGGLIWPRGEDGQTLPTGTTAADLMMVAQSWGMTLRTAQVREQQNVLAESAGSSKALTYPRISMETIIALAPDVIIDVGEMGETPADSERRKRITEDLWKRQTLVKAVRENGVRAVHDEAFVVPGPRVVVVAETLAEWFHEVRVR